MRGMVGALFLVFALCGNACAGASNGGSYNAAIISCADFLGRYSEEVAARNAHHIESRTSTPYFFAIRHYVLGWLTAYNMLTPDTYDIIPNGIDGALLWLNNYCSANPLQSLDAGLQALTVEAYPSRQQKAPGQ